MQTWMLFLVKTRKLFFFVDGLRWFQEFKNDLADVDLFQINGYLINNGTWTKADLGLYAVPVLETFVGTLEF